MTAPDATPEPGADALDTPEVREALCDALARVVEAFDTAAPAEAETEEQAEARTKRDVTDAILAALAPYVVALRLAAWREGVEAAAALAERIANRPDGKLGHPATEWDEGHKSGLLGAAIHARALSPPAAFAAPGPDAEPVRAAFHRGREAGRDDALGVCERYADRERVAANEAREAGDAEAETDCIRGVHVAEGIAAYIEMLGPVEDAEKPAEAAHG